MPSAEQTPWGGSCSCPSLESRVGWIQLRLKICAVCPLSSIPLHLTQLLPVTTALRNLILFSRFAPHSSTKVFCLCVNYFSNKNTPLLTGFPFLGVPFPPSSLHCKANLSCSTVGQLVLQRSLYLQEPMVFQISAWLSQRSENNSVRGYASPETERSYPHVHTNFRTIHNFSNSNK